MSEAPKRVWVSRECLVIAGGKYWAYGDGSDASHIADCSLFVSAAALRELCEKWRKKQKFFYSCEDSKEVRHGTGIREVCDELEKLLEGK